MIISIFTSGNFFINKIKAFSFWVKKKLKETRLTYLFHLISIYYLEVGNTTVYKHKNHFSQNLGDVQYTVY